MTNKIKCKTCNTTLVSRMKHDFVTCNCPDGSPTRVSIDGGDSHAVVVQGEYANWEQLESDTEE
jgi:hypothetical protein